MSTIIMHEEGLDALLRRPSGPVGRYIEKKGGEVDIRATANAAGGGPGPEVRTTDLLGSIHQISVREVAGELQTDIVADASHRGFQYGIAQELGGFTPQGAYYRYPFLEPALAETFGQQYRG